MGLILMYTFIFLFGIVVGIIATLIYWPWVEDKVMKYDDEP
jgi:hypothetical protein